MSAQHEPKEPRRALTREEFAALIGTYEAQAYDHGYCEGCASYDDEGLSGAKRTAERAKSRAKATGAALLAAFDAIAAERDEWKRRAEAAQSEAVRVVQVHQHEWLMRASARETFENYVMRVMAASGADANFDDCFRNIIADYDRVLARADKAEAERDEWKRRADSFSESYDNIDHRCNVETERADKAEAEQNAALAKLNDWRFARWRELPEAERKVAGDLLNQFGHLAKDGPHKEKARLYWWAMDCLEALGEK